VVDRPSVPTFITESAFIESALIMDIGRFSWSCDGGWSSSPCGVLLILLIGAPRSGTRLIRRDGAGVIVSCTGVFEPDPLREIRNFGLRVCFSGELTSFCANNAVVKALSFIGCGISSSELSPMLTFCIIGASAEKP
jgi:hypothetical protein